MARLPNHYSSQARREALACFERGQSLVEFTLLIPFLLVMLFGGIEVGRAVYVQNAITNAAYEGADYAMRNPTDFEGVRQKVLRMAVGVPLSTDDIEISCSPCEGNAQIVVTINYRFEPIFTPLIPSILLHAEAEDYLQ